jgi:hypothetical protein
MARCIWACLAWLVSFSVAHAAAVGEIEGVPIDGGAQVEGSALTLNGAGLQKRGFLKTNVSALYLSGKRDTVEGVETAPGAKRLQLILLRDIPGSLIARYFVSDFQAAATEAEFKTLIKEIGQIGAIYGRLSMVHKGDVVNMDWIPGKGIYSSLNGKPLVLDDVGGAKPGYMNNELMYRLLLRMYIGGKVSTELRENILGRSRSMLSQTVASN